MNFDREILEVVAKYLMEKFSEMYPDSYPSKRPAERLKDLFWYTLNGNTSSFVEFVKRHCEQDYILNELRKEVVEPIIYSERKSMLQQVDFFLAKLAALQHHA